ncbi:hypothetical protein P7F60_10795 [Rhizobium sp. YJ-22]|uniref:hypothetical protein n=1 Tax=Rhizobium sp. YJ-22 TaxID=3037556 RepID=UPI002412947E|nr:hypothetical protein [Rhizobium sp. YJ-22]MDG3576878.1 hypothetical protein [Rhizobium sp. YJ-22]
MLHGMKNWLRGVWYGNRGARVAPPFRWRQDYRMSLANPALSRLAAQTIDRLFHCETDGAKRKLARSLLAKLASIFRPAAICLEF